MALSVAAALLTLAAVGVVVADYGDDVVQGSTSTDGESSGPTAIAAPAPVDLTEEEEYQVSVRERFGLETSPEYIRGLAGLPVSSMGIPLAETEEQELRHRETSLKKPLRLIEGLLERKAPETFAGVWLDHQTGGEAVVATTSEDQLPLDEIRALLPSDAVLRIETVQNSQPALLDQLERVRTDKKEIAALDIDVFGSSLLLMENKVEVLLAAGSEESDAQRLRGLYQNASTLSVRILEPEEDAGLAVDRYSETGALYGGRAIYYPAKFPCTNALSAKGRITGNQFGITAGHCDERGSVRMGSGSGDYLGELVPGDNGWFDPEQSDGSTFCDCTGFGPLPAGKATNSVIVNTREEQIYTYTVWGDDPSDYGIGKRLCVSGRSSNRVLYDVIRDRLSELTDRAGGKTTTVKNLLRMRCPIISGDSGAPAGSDRTWMGVLTGGTRKAGFFACGDTNDGITFVSRAMYVDNVTNNVPNLNPEP